MAVIAVFEVSGMTSGQYDEVIQKLEAAGYGAPEVAYTTPPPSVARIGL